MEDYRRVVDGKFIEVVPLFSESSEVTIIGSIGYESGKVVIRGLPDEPIWVGPAGRLGYNILLSTDYGLQEVLEGFGRFLDPTSKIRAGVYGTFLGDYENELRELSDLLEKIKVRDSDNIELTARSDGNTASIHRFWYIHNPGKEPTHFGFNVDKYEGEIFDIAYRLTNFPIHEIEKLGLRELLMQFQNLRKMIDG